MCVCVSVWGVRFAYFISISSETKLFHFHGIFKNGWQGGGSSEPPLDPPLDWQISPVKY